MLDRSSSAGKERRFVLVQGAGSTREAEGTRALRVKKKHGMDRRNGRGPWPLRCLFSSPPTATPLCYITSRLRYCSSARGELCCLACAYGRRSLALERGGLCPSPNTWLREMREVGGSKMGKVVLIAWVALLRGGGGGGGGGSGGGMPWLCQSSAAVRKSF